MNVGGAIVGGGLVVVLILALIIVGPILVIWALNALFPVLAIPLTLKTWFATVIVVGALRANASATSK